MLLRNQSQELAIASRKHFREAIDEREPDRRLPPRPAGAPRGRAPWRAPAPDRAWQFRSAMPSQDRSHCLRDRVGFLPEVPGRRGRVPASPRTGAPPFPRRGRPAGTGSPGAVRSLLRERAARPVRPFRSHLGSQRSGPRPGAGPAAERSHGCMRSLSGKGGESRTPSVHPGSRGCRQAGRRSAPSFGPSGPASCGGAGSGCGCSPHSGSECL